MLVLAFQHIEWVGDLDSDNGGRLGLWQVCQKEDMSGDSCSKQLVDLMSISSTPFQVGSEITLNCWYPLVATCIFNNFTLFSFYCNVGGYNFRWPIGGHRSTYYRFASADVLSKVNYCFPHMRMDANSLR